MAAGASIAFGPFTFEPHTGSLWRGAALLPLLPKDAAILHVLLQHAGHVVRKETLLETVWPETYVTETVLKNGIGRLRRLLGDDPRTPQYIETRPRRGYRFLGALQPCSATQPASAAPVVQVPTPAPVPSASSSIVGREQELHQLQTRFKLACAGQRQVVCISGEAGMGKTTLVDTFVAQTLATEPLVLAYGQCVEYYGEGEPYRPVLEAIERLCRGPEGAQWLPILHQEAPLWLAQMPGLLTAREAEAYQQRLQQATPARMQRELAVVLERVTATVPVLLVLEDLHWSDPATLDLLAVLAQRRDPARFLMLGTYRPAEARAQAHALHGLATHLTRYPHYLELTLAALPVEAMQTYLTRRLSAQGLPLALIPWLQQRSGGQPLFLSTLVDDLTYQIRQHSIPQHTDIERLVHSLAQRIPSSLQQMLVARLERLSPGEQETLAAASAVGVEFSAAAVAAALAEEVIPVEARCEALARREEVLEVRGTSTWPDGTTATRYGFRHALYQQVLYAQIPAARRRQLHQRLGAVLERAYGEQVGDIATELARHWQESQATVQAVRYRGLAAQNAGRRSALREVMEHVRSALTLLATFPETSERHWLELRLQLTLGPALIAVHGSTAPEVVQTYARARALCQRLGEHLDLAQLGLWRYFYWGPGRHVGEEQL
ncbi:MAG: AAA family ATPase [Candidatus Tectimicrobiota bacterium]